MPPVTCAGIYDLPLDVYVSDPCPQPSLNAGAAHTILTQSPRHCWQNHPRLNPNYQSDESSRLDLGTIAHALLLEDDESRVQVIEADDWRTKAAKEQRDDARLAGRIPILAKDMATVRAMHQVAIDSIYGSELCEAWMDATPEQTLIWQEGDVWCRSRPDKLTKDGRVAFDFKTCAGSVHPAVFGRGPLIKQGYDLQAALAIRGIKALKNPKDCTFIFVCQEIEPPYAVSFVGMAPHFMAVANERLELALHTWSNCMDMKPWPAYPSRVAYLEPPSYYGMDSLPEEM